MNREKRNSGIDLIGDIPWGTHSCHFYENQKDLTDILVPYFKAGLEGNEYCLWVTAEPLDEESAMEAMRKGMPDFDRYLEKRQVEIVPHDQWYLKDGIFDLQMVLDSWIDKLDHALKQGYEGLRVTGNTAWLEKKDWKSFTEYEEEINRVIGNYRMIAICTYSLDRCSAAEVIDVVDNHQFALIRRQGQWQLMESTKHKQTEEALHRTEENFRHSLDESPLGIRIVSAEGETLYANRTILDIYGYASIEELKTTPRKKSYTPESYAEHQVRKEKRERGEYVPSNYEIGIVRKDGGIRHLEVFRKEVLWNGKTQSQVLYQDVTERKQTKDELRKSESKYRTLVQRLREGVYQTDLEGNYITLNEAGAKILGFDSPDQVVGKYRTIDLYHDLKDRAKIMEELRATGRSVCEVQAKRKDGTAIWMLVNNNATLDEHRNTVGYEGVFIDITERKRAEEALQRSEAKYSTLVERSNDLIIIIQDGLVKFANARVSEIAGLSLNEVIGRPFLDFLSPEYRELIVERYKRRISGEEVPDRYEIEILDKDGRQIALEVNVSIIQYEGRRADMALARDITKRKHAEEALRESKDRYLELVNLLPQPVFEADEKGNVTFGNLTGTLVFGYTLENRGRGLNVLQFFIPEDRKRLSEDIQRVLRGEQLGGIEYTALKKDGSTFPVLIYSSPVIRGGKAVGLRGITIDITERKRAEEALKESEARYRALIDLGAQVGEAIVMLQDEEQKEGVHVSCSDTWLQITGYSNEELRNMSFFELVHPQDRETSLARHREKMSGKSIPGLFEITIMRKDGTEVPIEITSAYSTYRGKRVNVAYIRDITGRKKMHEQLITQDRLASLGQLVSGVAHELNNPLTSVIGFSELLLKRDLPYDVKEDLETISREAKRTANIVKNLLTFARKQPQEKQLGDINKNIQRVLELRAHEQKISNIQVITRFASDLPQIMGNAFQLQQVFLNIIINAEFFMIEAHKKGTLTITTERIWDFVHASFADDGPGISKENMRHLFSPFFTTKEVGKGTGLGLSICHGIITEHGGRLYAESEPGKGATFIMELPIRQEAAGQGAAR